MNIEAQIKNERTQSSAYKICISAIHPASAKPAEA
jgi:hypothetical protein